MHEISFKSLPVLLISTIDLKFLLLLLQKKKRTKQTSSTDHQTFQSSSLPLSKLAFLSTAAVKRATGTKRKKERKKQKENKKRKREREERRGA